jgi:hypothetical protein
VSPALYLLLKCQEEKQKQPESIFNSVMATAATTASLPPGKKLVKRKAGSGQKGDRIWYSFCYQKGEPLHDTVKVCTTTTNNNAVTTNNTNTITTVAIITTIISTTQHCHPALHQPIVNVPPRSSLS